MTRARPPRICCAAPWHACPQQPRPGGWRCALMRGIRRARARAADDAHIGFAIGAKRIAPLWRLLAGLAEDDWHDAIGMDSAQVTVAEYCPEWWPANTALLVRRVALDPAQVSADPRSRRRRTLQPRASGALPIPRARQGRCHLRLLVHRDQPGRVQPGPGRPLWSTGTGTAPRWRTSSATASSAPRCGTSGYPQVNMAWMWGALLAASMAAWLHQLTATTAGEDIVARARRARRQGHDRHPAVAADRRPRPAHPPRPPPDPAAPARPQPASRGPGPAAGTTRTRLTCAS